MQSNGLGERVIDRRKGRIQLRPDALNDEDDCDRNTGRDETVLDCSGAVFVLEETLDNIHCCVLLICRVAFDMPASFERTT